MTTINNTTAYSLFGSRSLPSTTHSYKKEDPMNSSKPPMRKLGTYANGAGPTYNAPTYADAHVIPGTRLALPMPYAICVELRLWYPTNPPPRPLTTFAAPAALSSSLASPSRSVDISTADVISSTPSVLRPNTATAPGAWSSTTSHRTLFSNTSGCVRRGSKDVPNRPAGGPVCVVDPSDESRKNPNRRVGFISGNGPSR